MATSTVLSVAEYLARSEKPNCDYVDGVLEAKAMPTKLHAILQYLLITMLRPQGVEALAEVTVRLSPTLYRVPDVIAAAEIESPYPTKPVLLCVEILSPEDRISRAFAKCEDYHTWGTPYCWVIDPEKLSGWEYHAGTDPVSIEHGGLLRAGSLQVSLGDLKDALRNYRL